MERLRPGCEEESDCAGANEQPMAIREWRAIGVLSPFRWEFTMLRPAASWEYQWKFTLLVLSQPLFVHTGHWLQGLEGPWYSTVFSVPAGLVAVLLISIGTLLRVWGTSTLSQEIMGSLDPDARTLVREGPYAVLRNPLYLGSLLVFAGIGAFAGAPVAIALAVFHWVRYERVIRYEEANMRSERGSEFERYCEEVPRWIPRLRMLAGKSPHADLTSLLSNGLFVGIWFGSLMAISTRQLWMLYVSELLGGIVMATWHLSVGRSEGKTAPVAVVPITIVQERQRAAWSHTPSDELIPESQSVMS